MNVILLIFSELIFGALAVTQPSPPAPAPPYPPVASLPSPPPAPPGTMCNCNPTLSFGVCPPDTTLISITLTNQRSVPARLECVPSSQYNIYAGFFSYSTCYRWACYPPQFQGQSITISAVRITQYYNITQYYDRDLIPGGTSQLQIDEPSSVTTNVWARAANNTQLQIGPWNTSQVINLPVWGLDSLEIVTQVPYSPSLDGESVYVQINPVPVPPPPPVPASPPRPLFPPLPPFPLNATAAVADVVALEYIPSQQALFDMLNTSTASKSASIVDYLLIMPIFFSDFTIVPDCTASSQQALLRNVSSALNTTVSSFNSTCSYPYVSISNVDKVTDLPCTEARIALQVTMEVSTSQVSVSGGLGAVANQTSSALYSTFGEKTMCLGDFSPGTRVKIFDLMYNGSAALSRDQCLALAGTLMLPVVQTVNISCMAVSAFPSPPPNPPPPPSPPPPSPSPPLPSPPIPPIAPSFPVAISSVGRLSAGVIAGIVVGCVAASLICCLCLACFIWKRRRRNKYKEQEVNSDKKETEARTQNVPDSGDMTFRDIMAGMSNNPAFNLTSPLPSLEVPTPMAVRAFLTPKGDMEGGLPHDWRIPVEEDDHNVLQDADGTGGKVLVHESAGHAAAAAAAAAAVPPTPGPASLAGGVQRGASFLATPRTHQQLMLGREATESALSPNHDLIRDASVRSNNITAASSWTSDPRARNTSASGTPSGTLSLIAPPPLGGERQSHGSWGSRQPLVTAADTAGQPLGTDSAWNGSGDNESEIVMLDRPSFALLAPSLSGSRRQSHAGGAHEDTGLFSRRQSHAGSANIEDSTALPVPMRMSSMGRQAATAAPAVVGALGSHPLPAIPAYPPSALLMSSLGSIRAQDYTMPSDSEDRASGNSTNLSRRVSAAGTTAVHLAQVPESALLRPPRASSYRNMQASPLKGRMMHGDSQISAVSRMHGDSQISAVSRMREMPESSDLTSTRSSDSGRPPLGSYMAAAVSSPSSSRQPRHSTGGSSILVNRAVQSPTPSYNPSNAMVTSGTSSSRPVSRLGARHSHTGESGPRGRSLLDELESSEDEGPDRRSRPLVTPPKAAWQH